MLIILHFDQGPQHTEFPTDETDSKTVHQVLIIFHTRSSKPSDGYK